MTDQNDGSARADWEARIDRRDSGDGDPQLPLLATPQGLVARPGRGQVTLDWETVDGAVGYLVRRAESSDGEYRPLEIGEPWVRPVPHPPLTDTTGQPGQPGWYTVAAVASVSDRNQPASGAVVATPAIDGAATCRVVVDAAAAAGPIHRPWQAMVGAEHLSQLDHGIGPGGRHIGNEFAEALRRAHDELGVRAVRAHGILLDELGVYREIDSQPVHDFTSIDRIYDRVRQLGLRPVIELSFMPRDLAREPDTTVFDYRAIISPPKDWNRWRDLVTDLTAHLVDRYGLDEVRTWGFEVWNEPNLDVFWSGTPDEYFRLYDITAHAVKSINPELLVGGPATAAVAWIDELLDHVGRSGAPIDFISTHTYGNAPLDLRPITARHGRPDLAIWWTEWGAHASHFNTIHDSVWSAAYLVRGMVSAMGRADIAYWTISDHFEELGRPTTLLHGGFGLLSVGNLRKPRWWGLWMLEQLLPQRVATTVDGDAAGDMLDAIASRDETGNITIVVWNGSVDPTSVSGNALLVRNVEVVIKGLNASRVRVRHRRLDEHHSNLNATWRRLSNGRPWPSDEQWETLQATNRLDELVPTSELDIADGAIRLSFELPMPGVSLIELTMV